MVMKAKFICTKCKNTFETRDPKTLLCYECQRDADLNDGWDRAMDEIEREERYREQDGLDAPYE
jgi:Zn finger protein HypA/HybF involved in hydrogenase expression